MNRTQPEIREMRRVTVLLFFLLEQTLSLPAQSASLGQQPNGKALLEQADAARDAKKWAEAGQLYWEAARRLPNQDLELARAVAGKAHAQGHSYFGPEGFAFAFWAETLYRLHDAPPRELAKLLTDRARGSLAAYEPLRALVASELACQLDDTAADAWAARADAHYELGHYDEAVQLLQRARELDPNLPRAFVYTKERADRHAKKHPPLDDKADLSADLATASKANADQRYAEGIAIYTAVIQKQPRLLAAWTNRGIAHYNQHEYPEAISDYSVAISFRMVHEPNSPHLVTGLVNRAIAFHDSRLFAHAKADCTLALKLAPTDPRAKATLGLVEAALAAERADGGRALVRALGLGAPQSMPSAGKEPLK